MIDAARRRLREGETMEIRDGRIYANGGIGSRQIGSTSAVMSAFDWVFGAYND